MLSDSKLEDLYEITNRFPCTMGAPMTVWVAPRGNAQHDVRVRVNIWQLAVPSGNEIPGEGAL